VVLLSVIEIPVKYLGANCHVGIGCEGIEGKQLGCVNISAQPIRTALGGSPDWAP